MNSSNPDAPKEKFPSWGVPKKPNIVFEAGAPPKMHEVTKMLIRELADSQLELVVTMDPPCLTAEY